VSLVGKAAAEPFLFYFNGYFAVAQDARAAAEMKIYNQLVQAAQKKEPRE